jgi:hypothetical protein
MQFWSFVQLIHCPGNFCVKIIFVSFAFGCGVTLEVDSPTYKSEFEKSMKLEMSEGEEDNTETLVPSKILIDTKKIFDLLQGGYTDLLKSETEETNSSQFMKVEDYTELKENSQNSWVIFIEILTINRANL